MANFTRRAHKYYDHNISAANACAHQLACLDAFNEADNSPSSHDDLAGDDHSNYTYIHNHDNNNTNNSKNNNTAASNQATKSANNATDSANNAYQATTSANNA